MQLCAELFLFGKSYPLYEGPIWERHILVWDVLLCCKQSLSLWGVLSMFLLRKPSVIVCISGYSVYVGVPRQARRDVNPQVSSAGHSLQDLSM